MTYEVVNQILIQIIERHSPYLSAILLVGSLSREEGCLGILNEQPKLISDIDLVLITNLFGYFKFKLHPPKEKNDASLLLQKNLDLALVPRHKLSHLNSSFEFIDWKYSGKIVWGDDMVLKQMKNVQIDQIDIKSVYIALRKRMVDFEKVFQEKNPITRKKVLMKMLFSIIDIKLLQNGLYSPRLTKRVALAKEYFDRPFLDAAKMSLKYRKAPEQTNFDEHFLYDVCKIEVPNILRNDLKLKL